MLAEKLPIASPRIAVSGGRTRRLRVAAMMVAIVRDVAFIISGVRESSLARKTRERIGRVQAKGSEITVQKNTVLVMYSCCSLKLNNSSRICSDKSPPIIEAGIVKNKIHFREFMIICFCFVGSDFDFAIFGKAELATENPTIESKICPKLLPIENAATDPESRKLAIITSAVWFSWKAELFRTL